MKKTLCCLTAALFLTFTSCETRYIKKDEPLIKNRPRIEAKDDGFFSLEINIPYQVMIEQGYYPKTDEKDWEQGLLFRGLGTKEAEQILMNFKDYKLPPGATFEAQYRFEEGTLAMVTSPGYHPLFIDFIKGMEADIELCFYDKSKCSFIKVRKKQK